MRLMFRSTVREPSFICWLSDRACSVCRWSASPLQSVWMVRGVVSGMASSARRMAMASAV